MKVMVLGSCGSGKQIALALAQYSASKQVEIITIDSVDDIDPQDGDILICDDELTALNKHVLSVSVTIPCLTSVSVSAEATTRDNSFRGGSIGKGGKVKYRRN